jgi:hypothetical protein
MISSKTTLTMIGGGLIIQGLIFYAFAGPLTDQNFPGAGDEARHVGVIMRGGLAGLSCLAGLVIFLVRSAENLPAKRVLFGCAIGFAAISAIMVKTWLNEAAVVPLPALGLYMFTSCFALCAALKKQ